jgi:hypothetical protein
MTIRAFSHGGGVQSTAALVLAAQGEIDFPLFIFADTGDEHPETVRLLREVFGPWAADRGVEVVEVRHPIETLPQRVLRQRGISIPVWKADGAPLGIRGCTRDFKIRTVAAELRRRGATKDDPAALGLGISLDEFGRMKASNVPTQRHEWPLVDLRMDRGDCEAAIRRAGLPVPPKSGCIGCPYFSIARRREQMRAEPHLFAAAVAYERAINDKQRQQGGQVVYLTPRGKPLDQAVTENGQLEMFDGATCDVAGYCHA